jgi:hypothetical protein
MPWTTLRIGAVIRSDGPVVRATKTSLGGLGRGSGVGPADRSLRLVHHSRGYTLPRLLLASSPSRFQRWHLDALNLSEHRTSDEQRKSRH